MEKRALIGITVYKNEAGREPEHSYYLNEAYSSMVSRAGGLPVLLPYTFDGWELLDGVLIAGGPDLTEEVAHDAGEPGELLDPLAPVSMNFWGFTPWIFGKLEEYFATFLKGLAPDAIKAECLLPTMMGDLTNSGKINISVLNTNDRWFGLTYKEDKPGAVAALTALHENGTYPPTLWRG